MSIKATIIAAAVLVLGMSSQAFARQAALTDDERTIVQVFEAPNYSKDQIFTGAWMWMAEHFKSAKAVIEYENKDEGVIIGNGVIKYPCSGAMECMFKPDWTVPFTMRVESKDGRFRLTFTNVHLAWPAKYSSGIATAAADGPVWQRRDMDKIRPALLKFGEELTASLTNAKASSVW